LKSGADAARAEIVGFWRTVEMFSPQKVDKPSRDKLVFTVRPGQPLPWEPEHDLANRELRANQAWRHVVYLGAYRLDEVFEVLSRVFEPDKDSYDERPAGDSAVAAFVVDEDGRALLDSEVLSSCAWATGQLARDRHCDPDWPALLQDDMLDFSRAWRDLVTDELLTEGDVPQYVPQVLDHEALAECLAAAVTAAGTHGTLSCPEIRISSQIVSRRKADNAAGHDFLNSFIMGDLGFVGEQTAKGNVGAALRDYLLPNAEVRTAQRVDVRTRTGVVLAATAPDAVPAGRWPSKPEHALALNQQLAVSAAIRTAGSAGVMGVNGPPGTGKTTMLRDLIAGLVVGRARELAALSAPSAAFTGQKSRWRTGDRTRVLSHWRRELTGFEMVVASANNGAVQNVTDEIPAADAIDEIWAERAAAVDYFPAIAGALLAPEPDAEPRKAEDEPGRQKAWALVAARLGNKGNRSRFVSTFWYHTPKTPGEDGEWQGLLSVLKGYEQEVPEQSWPAAVKEFRGAEARVDALRAERSDTYQAILRRSELQEEVVRRRQEVSAAASRISAARVQRTAAVAEEEKRAGEALGIALALQAEQEQAARERHELAERIVHTQRTDLARIGTARLAEAEHAVRTWQAELDVREQAHLGHRATFPGTWEHIRTLGGSRKQWTWRDDWLTKQVAAARQELSAAHRNRDAAQWEIENAQRAFDTAIHELDRARDALANGIPLPEVEHAPLVAARRDTARIDQAISTALRAQSDAERLVGAGEAELTALDSLLEKAAQALGPHFPDDTWGIDRERREPSALWTDAEWNTARTELLFAALALHKAFLRHAATEVRCNLQAAMDVLNGDAPRDAPAEAMLVAWQSLFFVVPVVSTTFASYARLFGPLGKEALGWLLIDEAGQATPQNAVGALWRTRRALVVGDPLQLEPITSLPFRAEQAIRTEFGVDEQWLTCRTSVQRLADRLTSLGTWLRDDEGETWVGVPLTVHRRCDQPMFDIVNAVAYDGLMIDGTAPALGEKFKNAYPGLPESKWINVVGSSAQGHWIPDEGRQLDRILGTLTSLGFDMSEVMVIGPFRDIARQVAIRSARHRGLVAGTVHTAQGKQADVVILVLGSAPDRPGARKWASSKPNLLNVAVSRAKRRLYVIGNRQEWAKWRYFETLAADLPHSPPVGR
jgi:hypothetical protein